MNKDNYGIDVKTCGALGNGTVDDSQAIQKALDSGEPLVAIPFGCYKIGKTLRIGSHTRLVAHPAARILLADHAGTDRDAFLITNKNPVEGNENIRIEGGIWDGNNASNPRGPDAPDSYTGVVMNFINVRDLHVRRLTVVDAESYFIRIGEVSGFSFEEINFEAPKMRPNQDGLHLGGFCEDGVIRNLRGVGQGSTNDDLLALNADDGLNRAQNLGMKCGPIRRIQVEGLFATDCLTFLRMASVWSPISDITVRDIRGGCRCNVVNADALRYCRVPLFDAADPRYSSGVGLLENIHISKLNVHRTAGHLPLLCLETRMKNFQIEDFFRDVNRDADPQSPSLQITGVESDHILLEGLDETSLQDLALHSSKDAALVTRLPVSCYPERSLRAHYSLMSENKLVSRCREFASLEVKQSHMKNLPSIGDLS